MSSTFPPHMFCISSPAVAVTSILVERQDVYIDALLNTFQNVSLSLMNQQTSTTPNVKRNPTSSIAKHILETRHKEDPETSFKILLHKHNLSLTTL